ncbi:MAG: acyl-CoA desaturase [Patescibacteria group bacterium]
METIKTLPKFKKPGENLFFPTLERRIDYHFEKNRIKKTANIHTYLKAFILLAFLCGSYYCVIFANIPAIAKLILCIFIGIDFAAIGFNIMHDAGHGNYSKKYKKINELLVLSLNLVGANAYLWKTKHNILHHTYTNIENVDEDIDIPGMRVHKEQILKKYHKYQHIYWIFLYMFTYFLWVWYADFKKYFTGKINGYKFPKMKLKNHIIFWASKAFYTFYMIFIPWYVLGFLPFLAGYLLLCAVCGLFISIIFQLAHVVEGVANPVVNKENQIKEDWWKHEVQTTANFATKSRFINWFCGGLNFQIEHHLFTEINHVHYSGMSPIVKETCEEFGIVYNEKPTFLDALRSHINHLKKLGTEV